MVMIMICFLYLCAVSHDNTDVCATTKKAEGCVTLGKKHCSFAIVGWVVTVATVKDGAACWTENTLRFALSISYRVPLFFTTFDKIIYSKWKQVMTH